MAQLSNQVCLNGCISRRRRFKAKGKLCFNRHQPKMASQEQRLHRRHPSSHGYASNEFGTHPSRYFSINSASRRNAPHRYRFGGGSTVPGLAMVGIFPFRQSPGAPAHQSTSPLSPHPGLRACVKAHSKKACRHSYPARGCPEHRTTILR